MFPILRTDPEIYIKMLEGHIRSDRCNTGTIHEILSQRDIEIAMGDILFKRIVVFSVQTHKLFAFGPSFDLRRVSQNNIILKTTVEFC